VRGLTEILTGASSVSAWLPMIAKRIEDQTAPSDNPHPPPRSAFHAVRTVGRRKDREPRLPLAEELSGGEQQNMIHHQQSEFQEAPTVSSLKGALGLCRLRRGWPANGVPRAPQAL